MLECCTIIIFIFLFCPLVSTNKNNKVLGVHAKTDSEWSILGIFNIFLKALTTNSFEEYVLPTGSVCQ